MTSWATAERDYLDAMAGRPAAARPATLGEIWSASIGAAGLDTISGLAAPTQDAWRELADAVATHSGQSLAAFTDNWGGFNEAALNLETRAQMVRDRLGRLDKGGRDAIAPLIDIRKRAEEKAAAIEGRAADVNDRAYGLSGWATGLAAGIARQAIEPMNLATIPLGGPLKGPVLKMLGREALIGMGIQAMQEPTIEAARSGLGLDAGLGRAATNIGSAGLGAAGFAGLLRGGAFVLRKAFGKPEVRAAADISPEDLDAAANLVERDQVMDVQASPPTAKGRATQAVRIDEAAAAIEQGRSPASAVENPAPAQGPDVYGPPRPAPSFAEGFAPERIAYFDGDVQTIVRPGGGRLDVRPAVVELGDLTVSHTLDGKPNPNYPAALQPRDRSSAASRSFVAERAAELEPDLLGRSPTADTGAPIVGPDGVVESGNGRAMMLARAYDRHPERAAAYRSFLEAQGYKTEGFKFPVLVRIREGNLPVGDRAAFAREANVSPVAGLSTRERAFADAGRVDDHLLSLWQGGETAALGNVPFVRAFAERVVAAEERPQFVDAQNRLSADGRARVEAALVARAWNAPDVVAALYEAADPSSKAILGAFADTAPVTARLKVAIADGRVLPEADPTPALIEGFRLVERARASGQKVADLIDQVDIERGAVADDVRAAVHDYFQDDALRLAAGRDRIAARIANAVGRALDQQNAVGDLFGARLDVAGNLRAAKLAGEALEDQTPAAAQDLSAAEIYAHQPVDNLDALYERVPARQAELDTIGKAIAGKVEGAKFITTGPNFAAKVVRQLSSRSTEPLSATSAALTSDQGAPGASTAQAREPDMTAGRSSQLTNVRGIEGAPSAPDIGASPETIKATRAEADRVLEELGGDFEIFMPGERAGEFRRVSARQAIAEADEDAAAAAELAQCIVGAAAEGAA